MAHIDEEVEKLAVEMGFVRIRKNSRYFKEPYTDENFWIDLSKVKASKEEILLEVIDTLRLELAGWDYH